MSRILGHYYWLTFKAKAALAAVRGEQTPRPSWAASMMFILTRSRNGRLSCWNGRRRPLAEKPKGDPPVDLRTLYAKIGELTLENNFSGSTLTKKVWTSAVSILVVSMTIKTRKSTNPLTSMTYRNYNAAFNARFG